MIPENSFTPTPIVSSFQAPYNLPYTPLTQTVLGGVALNNPSEGRQYQIWNITYTGTDIEVSTASGPVVFSITESDVMTVSLAFDNNMALVIAWQTSGFESKLYYFDTLTSRYTTRTFAGTTSCRVCVDDAREFYTTSSDVIFSYTTGTNLYYRQQRDRYDVAYLIGATTGRLRKMAPNTGNRLQFELL